MNETESSNLSVASLYGRAVRTAATRLLPAMVEINNLRQASNYLTIEEVARDTVDQAQALITALSEAGFSWDS